MCATFETIHTRDQHQRHPTHNWSSPVVQVWIEEIKVKSWEKENTEIKV